MLGADALVPAAARLLGRQDDDLARPTRESLQHGDLPTASHCALARSARILQPGAPRRQDSQLLFVKRVLTLPSGGV